MTTNKITRSAELARDGWSAKQIASETGLSIEQAKEIIKRVRG